MAISTKTQHAKSQYLEATKYFVSSIGFILGFRRVYRVEIVLTIIGIVAFVISYIFVWGVSAYTFVITSIALLSPAIFQYMQYRRKIKFAKVTGAQIRIPPPTIPLFTILVSTVLAGLLPPLLFVAVLNTLFIEDITIFLSEIDIVRLRRSISILIEPITKRELLTLSVSSLGTALLSFYITSNPMVFIYPVISYIMLIYSLILVPSEYRVSEIKGASLLEEFSRRVPFLYFIFIKYYGSQNSVKLGREAGMIGASYYTFIKRMAGLFTLVLYSSLAVTPVLYIFLGNYAFATPLLVAISMFYAPRLIFIFKRNNRASKISRNLLLILTYLASMASVAEDFTASMQNLKFTPALAKMFGMEREVDIYLNIYRAKPSTETALSDYADTIPEDFYRDTVRTIKDVVENEGYGAVFRTLINRLRDFTTRYINRISTSYENIGSNVISVIILIETALPIMLFLSNPTMMPTLMLIGGIMSAMVISAIATSTLPDLPSEFIHSKQRYRKGALVFVFTSTFLTILEYFLLPNLLYILIFLNIVPAFFMTLYYVSLEDMALNNELLSKFPDLLMLFSLAMQQINNVEQALKDVSALTTFTARIRKALQRLSDIFRFLPIERLSYKGPYWYKYFMFLASISAKYGTTPRELYKAVSEFMSEFKKFFVVVSGFGRSMLFLTFIALIVMNIEIIIVTNFLELISSLGLEQAIAQFGMQSPLPTLSPEQLESMKLFSYVSLLITSIANGVSVAKAISGTFRDGKWILIMFVAELILLYIGITTSYGIQFVTGTTTRAKP